MVWLVEEMITRSDLKPRYLNRLMAELHDARANAGATRLSLDNLVACPNTGDA